MNSANNSFSDSGSASIVELSVSLSGTRLLQTLVGSVCWTDSVVLQTKWRDVTVAALEISKECLTLSNDLDEGLE